MIARETVPVEERRIFAMGGGGFTMEPGNPLLDDFVLRLAPTPTPRVLFLPTASGDTLGPINAFLGRFGGGACMAEYVQLFRMRALRRPLREIVLSQDIIYIGGGSMRNMLAIWHAHGLDDLLLEAWRRGTVLAGLSAGAMCWFEGGVSCSDGAPAPLEGIGLLPGSLTVHADGEPERLPVWLRAIREGRLPGGWALDDGVGMLFEGVEATRLVSSRAEAGAARVDQVAGELVPRRLDPEPLGSGDEATRTRPDGAIEELRRVRLLRRGVVRG